MRDQGYEYSDKCDLRNVTALGGEAGRRPDKQICSQAGDEGDNENEEHNLK
jgi:hypothetical protein